MSEQTYTLDEAQRELDRRACVMGGHNWILVEPGRMMCQAPGDIAPRGVRCGRCGWSGVVTMNEWP